MLRAVARSDPSRPLKSLRCYPRLEQLEDRSTPSAGLASFDDLIVDNSQYSSENILVHWSETPELPEPGTAPISLAHLATGTAFAIVTPTSLPEGAEDLGSGLFMVPVGDDMTV